MHRGSPTGDFLLYNTGMVDALNLGTQFSVPTLPSEPGAGRRGWKVALEVVAVLLLASGLIAWFAVISNQSEDQPLVPNKEALLRKMSERPAVSLTNTQKQTLLNTMVNPASAKAPSVTLTNAQRADLLKKMAEGK